MPKYEGWVIYKLYFKREVEAGCEIEAQDLMLSEGIDTKYPDDTDWDIYDVCEVKNETN